MERLTRKSEVFPNEYRIIFNSENDTLENTIAAVNKLGKYEDAEEQGLLVRLPCKVGDTVYVIYKGYVAIAKVLATYIDGVGGMVDLKITTNIENAIGFESVIDKDNYTFDNVFLTREDAEQALKEERKNGKSRN